MKEILPVITPNGKSFNRLHFQREVALIEFTLVESVCFENEKLQTQTISSEDVPIQYSSIANCTQEPYETRYDQTTKKPNNIKNKSSNQCVPETQDWFMALGGACAYKQVVGVEFSNEALTELKEDVYTSPLFPEPLREYLLERINFLLKLINKRNVINVDREKGNRETFVFDNTVEDHNVLLEKIRGLEPNLQEELLKELEGILKTRNEEAGAYNILLLKQTTHTPYSLLAAGTGETTF